MISRHSCKQTAILMTRRVDGSLGWFGRWRLEWHLKVCSTCRRLERQLTFLRGAARQIDQHSKVDPAPKEFVERIKVALREEDSTGPR